jgi:hypothetical protein
VQSVLLLGGYGAFGGRIAERLAGLPDLRLIIAGRSLERARSFAAGLAPSSRATLATAELDASRIGEQDLDALAANIVINASGPYQWQDYALARACIAAGAHYIDLADARAFVVGIGSLDALAKRAGVLVVSGASTVPAIPAAVIDHLAPGFGSLRSAETIIAPGNSFDPGLATTQSILSGLGRPFASGAEPGSAVHGWQHLRRRVIPDLGARWIGACETPDLDLLPRRYPGLESAQVFAALEVGAFHLGLWGLSWLVRAGILRRPERLARPLLAAKRALRFLGSDKGGMMVAVQGTDPDGRPKQVAWRLIAPHGQGPYIPATPSVILTKRLLAGTLATRGAMPCVGLVTLADFLSEVADLDITAGVA